MNLFAANFPDLKRLLNGGKTPRSDEIAKYRTWRDAILKRMREIHRLVPELDPTFSHRPDDVTPAEWRARWTEALAKGDPCRPGLTEEHKRLQEKYLGVCDAITEEKRSARMILR